MMASVTKFAAVNTKVKALERYLLSITDYQNMIQSKDLLAKGNLVISFYRGGW